METSPDRVLHKSAFVRIAFLYEAEELCLTLEKLKAIA